jgi:hypothetical protein
MGQSYAHPRINEAPVSHDTYCLVSLKKDAKHLKLTNPRIYFESGKLYKDADRYKEYPRTVNYNDHTKNQWCFSRSTGPFFGSCGVMTYDVSKDN